MFQLNDEEYENLRCKNSTSSWSGRRCNPYAFIVSLQKNAMKLKSSAVIWQGVIRKKQGVVIPWQGVKIKKQGVVIPWQGVKIKKQGVVIPWQGVKIKKQGV